MKCTLIPRKLFIKKKRRKNLLYRLILHKYFSFFKNEISTSKVILITKQIILDC